MVDPRFGKISLRCQLDVGSPCPFRAARAVISSYISVLFVGSKLQHEEAQKVMSEIRRTS